MATVSRFICEPCGRNIGAWDTIDVFLHWIDQRCAPACRKCNQPYQFHLEFPFAFGADGRMRVVDVFAPRTPCTWTTEDHHRIDFRPFLVIGETRDATPKRTAWLPYWHLDTPPAGKTHRKFGQWAPNMDLVLFAELVDQARENGYLL
jgi:hypothetical protein